MSILAQAGLNRVILAPYLLGNGKHATLEMDEILDDIAAQAPGVQVRLAQGLGADIRIADLIRDRIAALPNHISQPRDQRPIGILLVKAGTQTRYDDCLWLQELGSWVERDLGSQYAVSVAQSHYGDPTMASAAADLINRRSVGSVICAPYLFFPGLILQRNVLGSMRRLQQTYPHIPMSRRPPLSAWTTGWCK